MKIEDLIKFKNKLGKQDNYDCYYKNDIYNYIPCKGHLLGIKLRWAYIMCEAHAKIWHKESIVIKKFSEKDLFTLKIL